MRIMNCLVPALVLVGAIVCPQQGVDAGAAGQGTTVVTAWCNMTSAQRTAICDMVACLTAAEKATWSTAKGSAAPDPATSKWKATGTVCIGSATNRGKAIARTIYNPATGAVAGIVLFPEWFDTTKTTKSNQKFALFQEASRVQDGPLHPQPHEGKKKPKPGEAPLTAKEKLENEMWAALNNILVDFRDAKARLQSQELSSKPGSTSAADWKKATCANLEAARTANMRARLTRKEQAKAKIKEAKNAGVNVTEINTKLAELCKDLDTQQQAILLAIVSK